MQPLPSEQPITAFGQASPSNPKVATPSCESGQQRDESTEPPVSRWPVQGRNLSTFGKPVLREWYKARPRLR